jgi:hypothetical protein
VLLPLRPVTTPIKSRYRYETASRTIFINFVDPTGRSASGIGSLTGGSILDGTGHQPTSDPNALTAGEFFGAAWEGAGEGFNSPAGKFFTGAGIMIATGGSSSVIMLTTGLTAGTWKSLEGSAGLMAQATGQYDQFSESISLMPDSIPEVVGGLTGAAIDQSNGGDGMSGFEQGSKFGSVFDTAVFALPGAVAALPSASKNLDTALDFLLVAQSTGSAINLLDELTMEENGADQIDIGASGRALQHFNAANEIGDPVHGNNPKP